MASSCRPSTIAWQSSRSVRIGEDKRNFTAGWFTEGMPDLNQTNPLVATYLIQNNIWWIEYAGLSGLRVDTYGYSDTAFLAEWSQRLMAEYPHLNMVGEEWSKSPAVVSHWQKGKAISTAIVSHAQHDGLPLTK
jgi:glycosidase